MAALVMAASLIGASESSAQNTVPCAREGEFCRVPYETDVVYGARGRTSVREARPPGVPCTNRVFGDPAVGLTKSCAFVARGRGRSFDDGPGRGGRWDDDSGYGGRDRNEGRGGYGGRDPYEGRERRSRDFY